jgi:hypothetical protein
MLAHLSIKVKHSAEAAQFLHSEIVLHEGDEPRGRVLKRKGVKMVINGLLKFASFIHANHSETYLNFFNILTLMVPSIKCCAQRV